MPLVVTAAAMGVADLDVTVASVLGVDAVGTDIAGLALSVIPIHLLLPVPHLPHLRGRG